MGDDGGDELHASCSGQRSAREWKGGAFVLAVVVLSCKPHWLATLMCGALVSAEVYSLAARHEVVSRFTVVRGILAYA